MKLRSTALCALLFLSASLSYAQEGGSVTIAPPAPASYTDARPAYLFFKKIEITRRSKTTYDFDITLQGEVPHYSTADHGVEYFLYFDFDGVEVEHPEITNIPGFSDDMSIKLHRWPGEPEFVPATTSIEIHHKVWDSKLTSFGVNGNNISFTVQSPLFARNIQTNVMLYADSLQKKQGAREATYTSVSHTRPTDLNTGVALVVKPSDKPAPSENEESESLGSLLKP